MDDYTQARGDVITYGHCFVRNRKGPKKKKTCSRCLLRMTRRQALRAVSEPFRSRTALQLFLSSELLLWTVDCRFWLRRSTVVLQRESPQKRGLQRHGSLCLPTFIAFKEIWVEMSNKGLTPRHFNSVPVRVLH